jgi:hypothetical protein
MLYLQRSHEFRKNLAPAKGRDSQASARSHCRIAANFLIHVAFTA